MYGVFYKWGIPNSWMVHYFMENPSINGWFGGILGNLLIQKYFICPNGGIYIIICVYNNICCRIMVSTSRDCLDVGQKSGTLVNIGSGFPPFLKQPSKWNPPKLSTSAFHGCTYLYLRTSHLSIIYSIIALCREDRFSLLPWARTFVRAARAKNHGANGCRPKTKNRILRCIQECGINNRCTSKRTDGVHLLPTSMQLPEKH